MPYQVKVLAAEQWTLSRTAWTNTGQKIPEWPSELVAIIDAVHNSSEYKQS